MTPPIRCFMLEPTDRVRLSLRRYTGPGCFGPGSPGFHLSVSVPLAGDAPLIYDPEMGAPFLASRPERDQIPEEDPRWPTKCRYCDFYRVGENRPKPMRRL